ncbi:uncharacterized protein LOC105689229 [Athalia rosae]|uniref:uncharacterized protein LOC105689229 n=1 Tax=Athalia rosae TaxID=37344 RepID=UPI002034096A|nr:uncharacterized protein LOC105689229 [Athalia rosae]
MNQYVTTYRKDFFWPFVRTYPLRNGPTYATVSPPNAESKIDPCKCTEESSSKALTTSATVAREHADSYEWSRLGPMGPLLDPKLYPAKVGASPETPGMRMNQPNTYLKKLQEKYPYLYNVLQSAPADDMLKRIDVDRMRSTYQTDFCHFEEHPSGDYDTLVKSAGVADVAPCPPPSQLPGVDQRPRAKPIKRIEAPCKKRIKHTDDASTLPTIIPPWKSEYADGISRTGHAIIKDKLHHRGVFSRGKSSS